MVRKLILVAALLVPLAAWSYVEYGAGDVVAYNIGGSLVETVNGARLRAVFIDFDVKRVEFVMSTGEVIGGVFTASSSGRSGNQSVIQVSTTGEVNTPFADNFTLNATQIAALQSWMANTRNLAESTLASAGAMAGTQTDE